MKKNPGFTLIELIIVVAILGVLALVAAPKFINIQSDARIATLKATKAAIESSFKIFSLKTKLPSADIFTTGTTNYLIINNVKIKMNAEHYPVFSEVANINELYGLDALKTIVNIDVSDANNFGSGLDTLNYTFDTTGGFIIFTKNDDYRKSECYLSYSPKKFHDLIDVLPGEKYFQIVTSGC
ncbi:MAG: type II secretion system protein [Shewanella sp.]